MSMTSTYDLDSDPNVQKRRFKHYVMPIFGAAKECIVMYTAYDRIEDGQIKAREIFAKQSPVQYEHLPESVQVLQAEVNAHWKAGNIDCIDDILAKLSQVE